MTTWPTKTRDMHNHHFDSTAWDGFRFRDDDIVIGTYGKSGTTWLQQIIGQLIFAGQPDVAVHAMSPWLDLRVGVAENLAMLEAQTHRRFIKTHLPLDALNYVPRAKYIYVARDGRDVLWSLYNHHATANDIWYGAMNGAPGLQGPRVGKPNPDIRQYFLEWLDYDGYPFWSFWENIGTWWAARGLPNLMLLHFDELKRDLPGAMRRIAGFLDIAIDETVFPRQVEHCGFDWMKAHADITAPAGGALWDGGGGSFINKGTNGRWRDILTAEDNARYEAMALARLGAECAGWLKGGG